MSDLVERDSRRLSLRLHGGLQYTPFFVVSWWALQGSRSWHWVGYGVLVLQSFLGSSLN